MNRKKTRIGVIALAAGLLLAAGVAMAQSERIVVPLSDPGRPATLEVSVMTGSIAVTAWEGSEIVVVGQCTRARPTASRANAWYI